MEKNRNFSLSPKSIARSLFYAGLHGLKSDYLEGKIERFASAFENKFSRRQSFGFLHGALKLNLN